MRRVQLCLLLIVSCFAACKKSSSDGATAAGSNKSSAFAAPADEFLRLMTAGKNYLDQGDATNALRVYKEAQAITPNDLDLHLNLALAHLNAGSSPQAIREADEALKLEANSAAAYFIKGSAYLRLGNAQEAVKAFENARRIDPVETATLFQLGVAHTALRQWNEAIAAFQEGIKLEPNRLHTSAHYLLGQALLRAGREEEGQKELLEHQANIEGGGGGQGTAVFERSKYTVARVPFKLDQPERAGIKMRFVDATEETFGTNAQNFSGPVGLIDIQHNGRNSLFAIEKNDGGRAFRLLWNTNGIFEKDANKYPAKADGGYAKVLVGDLQNDRFEDVLVLGTNGSHLLKFATNGVATDVSDASKLNSLAAADGALIDLDFTGKLDLIAVGATNGVQLFRQFGPLLFSNVTSNSGIPRSPNAHGVIMENWNRDENMDLIVSRTGTAPLLLEKKRGGPLQPTENTDWVAGSVIASGDFDNDLRADLAVLSEGKIVVCFNGGNKISIKVSGNPNFTQLLSVDYDNDGWLDLWAIGESLRVWRNLGLAGFEQQTRNLGLDQFAAGAISEIHFADFDMDCDSDIVVALAKGGLRYLRNEGGNANTMTKVRLIGNRSNASGLGCRVEIQTGHLRLIRTVRQLPVEIGLGKYRQLDSFLVHWFNWPQGTAEIPLDCKEPLLALELTIQEGSCPYLYAWDGEKFSFVTDILGAAPIGLPVAEGKYIESDPEELVWIGNEKTFPPREGQFEIRITEELREVLYLDEAKLVVVDHEPGTEIHSTDKLLPGKPFPRGEFFSLHKERPLRKAVLSSGEDVTAALRSVDGQRASPPTLRGPQLRGLAEPHSIILDFGQLDTSKPLVLVMNGWLRFGGGMANIAASHDPTLPFPFPILEAEIAEDIWKAVEVTVGAPAGKTKMIVVDLDGKLPADTKRLRLAQAFEIHWDRLALRERKRKSQIQTHWIAPFEADLHFRGFSALQDLPPDWPLTPDYDRVSSKTPWTIIPGGWCTRYGDVSELVAHRDEGLALVNAGDELTLKFAENKLPPKAPGAVREFFLYVDGWDKDSDFHVAAGTTVEPLPFHGMDDQAYGKQSRPRFPSDALHRQYNTRWVDGKSLGPTAQR